VGAKSVDEDADVISGLRGVLASATSICEVNGEEGKLSYRGIDIFELAENSNFEEVVHLLLIGKLPTRKELLATRKTLADNREPPKEIMELLKRTPAEAPPMAALRTAVSALSYYDPDANDGSPDANLRKSLRLISVFPTMLATAARLREKKKPVASKPELGLAANLLYMLTGKEADAGVARAFDIALVLHAEHELNASTFAARQVASTLANLHASVTAAMAALSGPLHGGANTWVMKTLLEIKEPAAAEAWVAAAFQKSQKVPGFGHPVYKVEDPRAAVLRRLSRDVGQRMDDLKWFEISREMELLIQKKRNLPTNVDFYSASMYYAMGIPLEQYTALFAASRMAGWCAHIMEQQADNRILRPRAKYVGKRNQAYVPIEKRISD